MKLTSINIFCTLVLLTVTANCNAEYIMIDDGACNGLTGLTTTGHKCGVVGQSVQPRPPATSGGGQNANSYTQGYDAGYAKGYADAQRACGANGSASATNPSQFIPPPTLAQNPQIPTGPVGGDTGAGSCVTVTRNSKGEAILKNICSYRIFVWSCKQGMGGGLWPYEPGEKNNTYITGNISYAACKNTNPPYVSNTKTQYSTTCNKATGHFTALSYVCR